MNEAQELRQKRFSAMKFIANQRALAMLILIVVFCLIFTILFPSTFGNFENFSLILLNMSAEATIFIAIALVLINGEIDLSLGSIMVLSGILCGRFMIVSKFAAIPAILLTLVITLVCGIVNGIIVAKLNVPSFIATLACSMIYLGIAIMLAGVGWTDFPDQTFRAIGQTKLLGIQLPVYYMVALVAIFSYCVAKTRYFRQYYFIGSNIKAAELSGINVPRTKIIVYMIAALLAALGGIFSASRFNTSLTTIGSGVEMRAVTACVIGGVSFTGGTGTILGAALGALFVACLNNAITVAQINPDLQSLVTGVVLIGSIVLDIVVSKRK